MPALPEALSLLALEGAGEVQTSLAVPRGVALSIGDAVFFRHAKPASSRSMRGGSIEARAPTYRGLGQCFLG
jgi:hypothetical protein